MALVLPPQAWQGETGIQTVWTETVAGLYFIGGTLAPIGTEGVLINYGRTFTQFDNIYPDITCFKGTSNIECRVAFGPSSAMIYPAKQDATLYYRMEWYTGVYDTTVHVERGYSYAGVDGLIVRFNTPYTHAASLTLQAVGLNNTGNAVELGINYGSTAATFSPAAACIVYWRALDTSGTIAGSHVERGVIPNVGTVGAWATFASTFSAGQVYFPSARCQFGTSIAVEVQVASFTLASFYIKPSKGGGTVTWLAERIY
jgi:hypothetical protein